jgi:hypothetical protein
LDEQWITCVEEENKKTFVDSSCLYMIQKKARNMTVMGPPIRRDTWSEVQSFLKVEFEEKEETLPEVSDSDDVFKGFSWTDEALKQKEEAEEDKKDDNEFWSNMSSAVSQRKKTLLQYQNLPVKLKKQVSNSDLDDEIEKILQFNRPPPPKSAVRAPQPQSSIPAVVSPRSMPPSQPPPGRRGNRPPPRSQFSQPHQRRPPPPQTQVQQPQPPYQYTYETQQRVRQVVGGHRQRHQQQQQRQQQQQQVQQPQYHQQQQQQHRQQAPQSVQRQEQRRPEVQLEAPPYLGIGVIGTGFTAKRPQQLTVYPSQKVLILSRPTKNWLIASVGEAVGSIPVSCLKYFTPHNKAPKRRP